MLFLLHCLFQEFSLPGSQSPSHSHHVCVIVSLHIILYESLLFNNAIQMIFSFVYLFTIPYAYHQHTMGKKRWGGDMARWGH